MIIEYNGKKPKIGDDVFIAPTAVILGDVEIGNGSSIWFNAVLRGDMAKIKVGRHTNIQDNCTVHTDFGAPAVIGDNATIGHNAVVHGCTLGDHCLVGMGSVVLNNASIGEGSVVAAGSVVRERVSIAPWRLAAGVPAVEKRELEPLPQGNRTDPAQNYIDLAENYKKEKIGR